MADITLVKISALPAAEQIGAEDLLPVVQEGATKAVAYGVIKDDIANELAPDATLSEAGKAADAKAVGDALALKADKTELTAEVSRIDAALATKANTNDVNAALATKANTDDVTAALAIKADKTELTAGLATKQNTLTFDSAPTEGSTNPVTSGGVWEAIQTDKTLAVEDKAADAKITGEKIEELKNTAIAISEFSALADASEFIPVYVEIEQGRYNQSGVKDTTAYEYRCRTADILSTSDCDAVVVNHESKSYGVYATYFDASKAFVMQTNMQGRTDEPYVINKLYPYFSLVFIDYSNSSYVNPLTPDECVINFYVCKYNTAKNNAISVADVITEWGYEPVKAVYENGRLDATGTPKNDTFVSRARTTEFFSTSAVDYVVNSRKQNYAAYLFYYDENKVFQSSTSGQTGAKVAVSKDYAFVKLVVLNYNNNSFNNPITPIEAAENVMFAKESVLSAALTTVTHLKALDTPGIYPSYFGSQLNSVKTEITNHMGLVGRNGCTFYFITDLHWTNNQKHSAALITFLRNAVFANKIVMGGDYIGQSDNKQSSISAMQWCMMYFRGLSDYIFPIFGNHDTNSNGTTPDVYMTDEETYAIINQWINNEVVYGDNYFDYYWDDNKCNTRYVMIDTGAQSIDGGVIAEETFTWLNTVLNTDKNIVVFAHWLFSPTTWDSPLVDGVLTGSYTASATRLFNVLDSKNANGSKVQAIITGHVHCDYDAKTSGGIPIIWTDTDSMLAYGEYTATVGTVSEQCFDVITIDYDAKKVYCDRIGRGVSREIEY